MGVEANGRAMKGRKEPNGHLESPSERRSRRRSRKPRSSFSGWLFSLTARLAIWYAIITSLFFCPSSLSKLDKDSAAICKPYLHARSYLAPYVDPYYDAYVSPYVKQAEPYVNYVDSKIYTPASAVSKKYYNAYAAPSIDKVYKYADDEWEKIAQPYLQDAQKQTQAWYERQLAPYAKTATDNISPYYQATSKAAQGTYNDRLVPAYDAAKPYAQQAWEQGHHLTVNVIFPYVRWAGKESGLFLSRQVWPKLRILYGENVEPQFVRISERLGRYKDGKKLEAAVDAVESSSASSDTVSPSVASSIAASISESPYPSASSAQNQASGSPAPSSEAEIREKIESDLKTWQEKFAKAADKGTEDLEERVKEIVDRQIDHQAKGVGNALVVQLEETVSTKLKNLKKDINEAVKDLPEETTTKDVNAAHETIVKDIRAAGMAIREKAQTLRSWKQNYDQETHSLVKAASDSTLEVIDNIRDLGLQEMGQRWAWMEGVTYKDWSKYHALKKTFDEWREQVEGVAMKHDGLAQAKKEGDALEEKGMSIAEDAAKELARLKDVAKWKLHAGDATDDFSTRKLPAQAVKAAQQVMDKVVPSAQSSSSQGSAASESVIGSLSAMLAAQRSKASRKAEEYGQGASSAAPSASESINSLSSKASEAVVGSGKPAASKASSSLSSKSKHASSEVSSSASSASSAADSRSKKAKANTESAKSSVSSAAAGSEPGVAQKASSKASEAVLTSKDATDSLASKASSNAKSASSKADTILSAPNFKFDQVPGSIKGTPAPAEEASSSLSSAASEASEAIADGASTASSSGKKVVGGVSAGFVAASQGPVLDDPLDDETVSEKLQGFADAASQQLSHLSEIMAQAVKATPTQGTVESMTSVASSQWSSAMSAALGALYGPATETAYTDAVAERYSKAVTAASHAIYGTPLAYTASLASQASSRFSAATSAAAEQLDLAKSRVSGQVASATGKEPWHLEMEKSVESAYSGAVAQASSRLSEALKLTDSARNAVYPTQGVMESISSVAGARLSEAQAGASKQYKSAQVALGLEPPSKQDQLRAAAEGRYYQAIGFANDRYSSFVTAASTAAYGTPTPAYESYMSGAREQYAAATSAAGAFIDDLYSSAKSVAGAKPSNPSLVDTAVSQYDSAVSAAAANLAAASSSASVAFYGTSTGAFQSLTHQASENWEALVSKASEQVYTSTAPWYEAAWSSAGAYGAQITDGANMQYSSVQALVSELVVGKEPDFTESVMNRLNSAYATGFGVPAMASSVSSAASEAYESASSVVVSVFTPPATLENVFDAASGQFNAAVSAASAQVYGSEKGAFEKATSAAAEAADSATKQASEAVYGTQAGYVEQAQSQLDSAASSARDAVSAAFYGSTPTGSIAAMTSAADSKYSSLLSAAKASLGAASGEAGTAYEDAVKSVSSAVYGPEKGAFDSATSRLAEAVESARAQIGGLGEGAAKAAEDVASSVSSTVSKATGKVKDEL